MATYGTRKFASVAWTAGDVQTLRPEMTEAEAVDFLAKYEGELQGAVVSHGWEVMEDLLTLENEERG
jgi:hypothetical protein